ncbi:pyridoxamine 5'-phosphate oxidase family protein [Lonsdalea quercina]|uniref:Pyridoxamine 5'-phosphate oxidase N-terminal domain-containing protein n=1 Tax=Lonsdalea quercina TaxID=71657 RepID=A0A1H3VR65_9GAMM|nr:pyridoxamine 5'-phosphate oxidase family protein [Lonsdalea quercina]SDZ76744.1 hypothetical protein SAMN02982996_00128 [Lonsdalea quercina]
MQPLPAPAADFIASHHVLSLTTLDEDGLWSASCFYAFDADNASLIVLSSSSTRHGGAMATGSRISGTISGQPEKIRDIRGIQYLATVSKLDGAERRDALSLYVARHPIARLKPLTEVWRLKLHTIKFTDNATLFGAKEHWTRE